MIILTSEECPQGSPEWKAARLGIPTGSNFKEIVKPDGKPVAKTRSTKYMNTLVGEHVTGIANELYVSKDMIRGTILEPQARASYAFTKNCEPLEVGLVYLDEDKNVSVSPDSLIDDNGGWECKAPRLHNHIGYMLNNELPPEHKAQVQGCIWLCDREWWDFMSYNTDYKDFIIRVYRDEDYIRSLKKAVDIFVDEMLEKREQLEAL